MLIALTPAPANDVICAAVSPPTFAAVSETATLSPLGTEILSLTASSATAWATLSVTLASDAVSALDFRAGESGDLTCRQSGKVGGEVLHRHRIRHPARLGDPKTSAFQRDRLLDADVDRAVGADNAGNAERFQAAIRFTDIAVRLVEISPSVTVEPASAVIWMFAACSDRARR